MRQMYEAAYKGNIGIMEMIQLYEKMPKKEIDKLEDIIANEDWESYKKMVKKYIGVDLK